MTDQAWVVGLPVLLLLTPLLLELVDKVSTLKLRLQPSRRQAPMGRTAQIR